MLAQVTTEVNIDQTKSVLQQIGDTVFNGKSFLIFVVSLLTALILGGIISMILRHVSRAVARTADASTDLATVNRLRNIETWITLSIAIIRIVLIAFAIYFWWMYTHPNGSPSNAIIGASAVVLLLIGGIVGPLLRDFAFGAGMIAERWFGVGDLVTLESPPVSGVVERITLRSTRLRSFNGEAIWVANQNMNGVRIAQKGSLPTAIELFVSNADRAEKLIAEVNKLLPSGPALLVSPLKVVSILQRDNKIWHVTAIGETAPGREWIIQEAAVKAMQQIDEKSSKPTLLVDPIYHYADRDTERQFARAVKNAKKKRRTFRYRKVVSDERTRKKRT